MTNTSEPYRCTCPEAGSAEDEIEQALACSRRQQDRTHKEDLGMTTTATEAWQTLSAHEQAVAHDSGRDGFSLGFTAGWKAQENRPFHCAWCSFTRLGATDAETLTIARDHTLGCESHPLAAEIRQLRSALEGIAEGCGHQRCHAYPWIRAARKALAAR